MRGQNTQGQLIKIPVQYIPPVTKWNSLIDANQYVLSFETVTTNLYHSTISTCEQQAFDDYHVNNWLSHKFLGKQLDGMKIFADRVSSLQKMKQDHQSLGEYLYDIELYYNLPDRDEDDY
ncbi:ferritin heavy chain-like [Atheta coriaria]|uniref:ferritin heavy chain-like n=1 Tax=Dalotia coriaria TaxID=877792 RepID=UPI0031F440F1